MYVWLERAPRGQGCDHRWSYKVYLALPRKRGIADFWAVWEERCSFVITQFLFTCSDALNLPSRWGAARCRRVTSSQRPRGAPQVGANREYSLGIEVPHVEDMM